MVAVERLDDHGEADPAGRGDRALGRAHRLLLGHRQPGRAEQLGGHVLVAGDVDGQRAGLRRHRGADPLLVHALAELHQAAAVEPDEGDVAADRLLEDGPGRRAERGALGAGQEGLELGGEVEPLLLPHQVVDQAHREPPGRQADLLVGVAVDDVVDARCCP